MVPLQLPDRKELSFQDIVDSIKALLLNSIQFFIFVCEVIPMCLFGWEQPQPTSARWLVPVEPHTLLDGEADLWLCGATHTSGSKADASRHEEFLHDYVFGYYM